MHKKYAPKMNTSQWHIIKKKRGCGSWLQYTV